MSLSIMAQQCTLPSFWDSLAASATVSHKRQPSLQKIATARRFDTALGILKASEQALSIDDILAAMEKSDPDVTRNIVAHTLRCLRESNRITKEVRRATPSTRVGYWMAV